MCPQIEGGAVRAAPSPLPSLLSPEGSLWFVWADAEPVDAQLHMGVST